MQNKKRAALALIIITVLLVLAAVIVDKLNTPAVILHGGESLTGKHEVKYLEHDGRQYRLRRDVQSVLLIGTDTERQQQENEFFGMSLFYNYAHADFVGLLVFDNALKTITLIQLDRDTMCDVPWLTVNGLVGGTEVEQLSFAHTYGSGGKDSCVNTANAVSNLLFGLPVEAYAAIPMSALPVLNDLAGGVTLHLESDYTDISSEYISGVEVTLSGNEALDFVRARKGVEDETNISRMSRQRLYMNAFLKQFTARAGEDELFVLQVLNALGEDLVTNLETNLITAAVDKLQEYQFMPVVIPEGKSILGEKYMEFYVDEDLLWPVVKRAFCR